MNILVIGSGGREHALVWKIHQSPRVEEIFCAPGNAGIAELAKCVDIKATDIHVLSEFVKANDIDLTVVGPEQPLTVGIVDHFEREGLKIFGPSKLAAELEGSKVYAKQFMKKYGIPTAAFGTFDRTHRPQAMRFIEQLVSPIVVKADGLAAGKGVLICESKQQALQALDAITGEKAFGSAGDRVVIEEYLDGEEMSVFALTDGADFVLLTPAQDHKRIFDGDAGKNTGGMGAYAPAPAGTRRMMETIRATIVEPTIQGMLKEQRRYKGCLYVGLMLTSTGPKVLEYNCRFGDPEAQVVLPLIENDIVELFLACVSGEIRKTQFTAKNESAVCVVMASQGYPDSYEAGKPIQGLDSEFEQGVMTFHAGTKREADTIVTAGGRVLGVMATGLKNDLQATVDKSYRAVTKISFEGAYYRRDIGKKGVERLKQLHTMEAH